MGTVRGMSLQDVLLDCFLGAQGPVPSVRSRHLYPTESAVPGVLACSARDAGLWLTPPSMTWEEG